MVSRYCLIVLSLSVAFAQTARFPSAIAGDSDLISVVDGAQTTLSGSMTDSATQFTVASASKIVAHQLLSIGNELVLTCNVVGTTISIGYSSCPNVDGRGYSGTVAASHTSGALVSGNIDAWHHNSLKAEVKAIETALGTNLANVIALRAAAPVISSADYIFSPQTPGGSLSIGSNTITLTPCPLGVSGSDASHYLYIQHGTGTAEAVPITGGTCASGAATGTLIITAANTHSGAWTIESATNGQAEAVADNPNGAVIQLPAGTLTERATVTFGAHHAFIGAGTGLTIVDCEGIGDSWGYSYFSAVLGSEYDVVSSIWFQNFTFKGKNGIQLNNVTIPGGGTFQGNLLGLHVEDVQFDGVYSTISDSHKWTNVVPTISEMRGYGTAIRCVQCFKGTIIHNQIEDYGIGIEYDGDEVYIGEQNRISFDGWLIYMDGTLSPIFNGNQNIIEGNKLSAIMRMGGVVLNGTISVHVTDNYMESYCPSSQFVKSTGSYGTLIAGNRMDDPNNSVLCVTAATNSTPIFNLDDFYGVEITNNFMQVGVGTAPGMLFGTTHYSNNIANIYRVHDNDLNWPEPTGTPNFKWNTTFPVQPTALVGSLDPYLFRVNNIPGGFTAGFLSMPWTVSGTTGRYVLSTQSCCWVANFPLQNAAANTFAVNVTGRKNGTGAGFLSVDYVGTGTTNVFGANLNFTATSGTEVKTAYVTVPAGEVFSGRWAVSIDTSQAEIESIQLVPLRNRPKGIDIASAGTISVGDWSNGDLFVVTGTTGIATVNTCSAQFAGRRVTLMFSGALTVTDGSNLKLAGNFVTTADDTLTLACDGTNWVEVGRSVN